MNSIAKMCIFISILSVIAGCSGPCNGPASFDAQGIVDSDGNPHFILSNDHRNNVMHVWRDNGRLHKDEITPLPGERVEAVTWADNVLCAYTTTGSGQYRGCKAGDGSWDVRNRLNVIPNGYTRDECLEIASRLDDGRIVMACAHQDASPQVQRFFMIDDITGSVGEYKSPLDVTKIINHDAAPFDLIREPRLIQSLFFDEDTWDGKSFIYGVVFESKISVNFMIRLYYVSHDDSGWTISKTGEIGSADYGDMVLYEGIFKGKRTTLVARQAIVKRDASSGSVMVEALAGEYASLDKKTDSRDRIAHVVTSDGRFHVLVRDESRKETVLYYYMYNPDSSTPEVPETVERLDSVGRR